MPTAYLVAIENGITERQYVDLRAHMEGWRELPRLDRSVTVVDPVTGARRAETVAGGLIARVWSNPMLELGPGGISCHPATAAIWALVEPRAPRGEGPITGWRRLDPPLREAILAAARTRAGDGYFAQQVGGERRRDRDFFRPSQADLARFLDAHAGRPLVVVR